MARCAVSWHSFRLTHWPLDLVELEDIVNDHRNDAAIETMSRHDDAAGDSVMWFAEPYRRNSTNRFHVNAVAWSIAGWSRWTATRYGPRCQALLFVLLIVGVGCSSNSNQSASNPAVADDEAAGVFAPESPIGFVKGHSWGYPAIHWHIDTDESRRSISEIPQTNAEWICISFAVFMETFNTPEIGYGDSHELGARDQQLLNTIEYAKSQGLQVILKPMMTLQDGKWRATIAFDTDDGTPNTVAWSSWWTSYKECLVHYGQLAEAGGCELYCLGCEMNSTEPYESDWRDAVARVRAVYSGPLTYDVNFTTDEYPRWFDELDLISLSAYYHIGTDLVDVDGEQKWVRYRTVEEMSAYLETCVEKVRIQAKRFDLPVLFIESGVCSAVDATRHPWKHPNEVEQTYSGEEQAIFYEVMFRTMWDKPWFAGFCWWNWPIKLYPREKADEHIDFAIYGKPAEDIVRQWYAKPRGVPVDGSSIE